MFDIGWGELVVIAIVALVVIGPKELPTVLRTMSQWMTKIRRMAAEFQGQFQEAMREAELADLKKQVDSMSDFTRDLTPSANPLETARREIESAFEDKPATPAPAGEAPTATAELPPSAFADGAVTASPVAPAADAQVATAEPTPEAPGPSPTAPPASAFADGAVTASPVAPAAQAPIAAAEPTPETPAQPKTEGGRAA